MKRRIDLDLYINRGGLVSLWSDIAHQINPYDMTQALTRKKTTITDLEVLEVSVSRAPLFI
jgi:hypothetical protein